MKLSELIEIANTAIAKHGDMLFVVKYEDYVYSTPICASVEINLNKRNGKVLIKDGEAQLGSNIFLLE